MAALSSEVTMLPLMDISSNVAPALVEIGVVSCVLIAGSMFSSMAYASNCKTTRVAADTVLDGRRRGAIDR